MIIAKNDEMKRSKIWRIVTAVTTILIIVIAAYFIIRLFTSNPLEGTWESQDRELTLTIKSNNSLTVSVPEVLDDVDLKLKMNYTIDKEEKTITIKEDEAAIEKAVKASDGALTEDMVESALSSITTTFSYSVDQGMLTLTEREYGEQMMFDKQ